MCWSCCRMRRSPLLRRNCWTDFVKCGGSLESGSRSTPGTWTWRDSPAPKTTESSQSGWRAATGIRAIDVVVSVGRPAGAFLREHGSSIWPHARRVFAAVSEEWARGIPPEGDIVIATNPQYRLTAEGALRLLPDIRQVFLIAGSTDSDRRWLQAARADLQHARQAARGARSRRPHLGRPPRASRHAAGGLGGHGGRVLCRCHGPDVRQPRRVRRPRRGSQSADVRDEQHVRRCRSGGRAGDRLQAAWDDVPLER